VPSQKQLSVVIHYEDGEIWAEIPELPGCFASGRTLAELTDAVEEAVGLYLATEDRPAAVRMTSATLIAAVELEPA
jgi:predicted RNase H-like HicB family nuclease